MAAVHAFCTTCQRDVHLGADDDLTCPVCSAPLIENTTPTRSSLADGLPSEAFLG